MKKIIISLALIVTFIACYSQKTIENPKFAATTSEYVRITKIELHDTATIIDFEVEYKPKFWIHVSSTETFIQDSKGGQALYVKGARGIVLDENHWTPESGLNEYTLFFPPLDPDVETIDFLEQQWKILEIELVPKEDYSLVPDAIQGNWLRTDGSNKWEYGFYDNMVVFEGQVWKQIAISQKNKGYQITIQNKDSKEHIFIKKKKADLLIGDSPENLTAYSKKRTRVEGFQSPDDEEFTSPILRKDSAVYSGLIQGYHPKMGKSGMVYINNIFENRQENALITIHPDGFFELTIPLTYPQLVLVRMIGINLTVYLEPGKKTFHLIDYSEFAQYMLTFDSRNKRQRKSLFMGDVAKVNDDLQLMDSINYFNYNWTRKQILDMDAHAYKKYCLYRNTREKEAFKKFCAENSVNTKSKTIKECQINYWNVQRILSYNMYKSSAYREKNKIPREQREIPLEKEELTSEYFDFIDPVKLNNPISLASGGDYYFAINRMKFSPYVRPQSNYFYLSLKDSIAEKEITIDPAVESVLEKLIACKTWEEIQDLIEQDSAIWNPFLKEHSNLMSNIRSNAGDLILKQNLEHFFGIKDGFAMDIMKAQDFCGRMRGALKPLDEKQKKKVSNTIEDPFIEKYVLDYSQAKADEITRKLEANKLKTGYKEKSVPKVEADSLFEAIMQNYKGKVVFVDFWATWCGPCRAGFEKIKPLKKDMAGKDLEFVYITNPTSPKDTWELMIPDIHGDHYRVSQDEWNHLSSKFNITGIPHYVLVGKEGEVLQDRVYFASSIEALRNLFLEALDP